jgi:L-fuconolactonase
VTGSVDAHHHLWDLSVRDHDWIDPDRMARIRRDFGPADLAAAVEGTDVRSTVLVQSVPVPAETRELLAVAAAGNLVAGVVGWVDLTAPDVAGRLAGLAAAPGGDRLVGVRHLVQAEPDPRWLCRPDVRRGLAAVAAADLAYDLLVVPQQLPAAVETVRALPQLRFVLDHLAKPPVATGALDPWAGRLRELAAAPNVTAKLSGLVTEATWGGWTVADLRPYAAVAVEAFGADRLMYGSDWPVCLLAATGYRQVLSAAEELTAGLSAAERAAVFGRTARRVYRLRPPAAARRGPEPGADRSATGGQAPGAG